MGDLPFSRWSTILFTFLWIQIRFKRDQKCCEGDLLSLVYVKAFSFSVRVVSSDPPVRVVSSDPPCN